MRDVVIIDAVRSPIGKRNGGLATMYSTDLLGGVVSSLMARSAVDPATVGQVVGGCVNQLGMQASNVARHAWLAAGLPVTVAAATINTQCGSSQEATRLAHGLISSGLIDIAVACGVEVMSRVPMGANVPSDPDYGRPRGGSYPTVHEPTSQFEGADRIAHSYQITRQELEGYALRSQARAAEGWRRGHFVGQVVPIEVPSTGSAPWVTLIRDEGIRETTLAGLAELRPNRRDSDDGMHTAGTSSQISDGAAALLLMAPDTAAALELTPRARIVDAVLVGSDPVVMLTGPIPATRELMRRTGLSLDDIDLFEVNEAFAAVVLAWQRELQVPMDRVNVNGGAIALGHPLGATGAILLTKALYELERRQGRFALVTMCCGGGLGTGMIIERMA